jgi:hypothetical protein
MTVERDEEEIKYPLSPTVTLSAAMPPSPNNKEWKIILLAIWGMNKDVLDKT